VAVLTALLPVDWAVLAAYLALIVGFGVWVGRRTRDVSDFFLAGREMRWWAAGLSVMATQIKVTVNGQGNVKIDRFRALAVCR